MKRWLSIILLGFIFSVGLYVGIAYFAHLGPWTPPKPYQEVADALAEYGWEVIDISVDPVYRAVRIAAIPPEDDTQYVDGFFYILEWASPLMKPPAGSQYPGALFIAEVTDEGCYVLLANGKVAKAYGITRLLGIRGNMVEDWLGTDADGTPWQDRYEKRVEIYATLWQLQMYGLGYYGVSETPEPYVPLEGGWFQIPEEPSEE